MNEEWKQRTELLYSEAVINKLSKANILIVGVGGVGGNVAEMLCRAGIENITLIDNDVFSETNLNRQILSLKNNLGKRKCDVAKERLLNINPSLNIKIIDKFIDEHNVEEVVGIDYDLVIDAIDTVTPKFSLINHCLNNGVKIISSMGAGGKTEVSKVKISDISQSYNCGLARQIRKKLYKAKVYKKFRVVFSPEEVSKDSFKVVEDERYRKTIVGVVSYMPTVFACYISEYAIDYLISIE